MSFMKARAWSFSRITSQHGNSTINNGVRASFSSHQALLNNKEFNSPKNTDTELPRLKISDLASTRRGRIYLYSTFAVLATIESLTWWNAAPRVFGWGSGTDSSDKDS